MKRLDWNEQWTLNRKQITLPYDAMLSEQREPGNPAALRELISLAVFTSTKKSFLPSLHRSASWNSRGYTATQRSSSTIKRSIKTSWGQSASMWM